MKGVFRYSWYCKGNIVFVAAHCIIHNFFLALACFSIQEPLQLLLYTPDSSEKLSHQFNNVIIARISVTFITICT